jgi:hypothetical protein
LIRFGEKSISHRDAAAAGLPSSQFVTFGGRGNFRENFCGSFWQQKLRFFISFNLRNDKIDYDSCGKFDMDLIFSFYVVDDYGDAKGNCNFFMDFL